jgi:hypothetical protein
MANKKPLLLRIDIPTYQALEKWANDEFRSVNGHLEWLIDKALRDAGRKKYTPEKQKPKAQGVRHKALVGVEL